MKRVKDLKGIKFNHLTVLSIAGKDKYGDYKWLCKCDCGLTKEIKGGNLRGGYSKCCSHSCPFSTATKHLMSGTPEFVSWCSMNARCYNTKTNRYENYGGRGIKVCDRWKNSFKNFYKDMGKRPKGFTLDRIDPNGDYTPENCRWATYKEQAKNRKSTYYITFNNQTLTKVEWAKKLNIKYSTLSERLRRGWSIERAFNERPEMHHLFR
jgi:hypothetical protein